MNNAKTALTTGVLISACAAAMIMILACGRPAPPAVSPDKPEAFLELLDIGWHLACTIENDKDRAKTQQEVVEAALDADDGIRALNWCKQMEGWRRRVGIAETAAWMARKGMDEKSLALVRGLESEGRVIEGWQHDRVQMHIMEAKAFLGLTNETARTQAFYSSNRDCYGPAGVYHAVALAIRDENQDALNIMTTLGETNFFDTLVWRVRGYNILAKEGRFPTNRIDDVMQYAWNAVTNVPGPIQHELRTQILGTWTRHGRPEAVRSHIGTVFTNLINSPIPGHITIPQMGRLAVEYGRIGDIDKIQALEAESLKRKTQLQGIEYYLLYTLFGEAYATAGEMETARDRYREAMNLVAKLFNPRPRAMAAVDLVLSMFRCEYDDPEIVSALEELLADFHAKAS